MANQRQPLLVGFENADATNALLGHLGLAPDLGAFLSEHLLMVFRQQYDDLYLEYIEFIGAGNCTAGGVPASEFEIIDVKALSMPIDLSIVLVARKERYNLRLRVILNANLVGVRYDVESDVKIQEQKFLGAL